ncbi:MAG TPA: His/Gly/Thr/Pro-type tRNA ligase C-terminal domain-containing protein, partial [Steroidobacteraceae bacterium]
SENLKNQGLRVETDLRYEKVGFKIREHTIKRVPFLLVAGEREVEGRTLSVRTRAGEDLGTMELPKLYTFLREEVASRGTSV